MLTVPQAAKLVGRDPETIRRWIRSGKLPAGKVGTQHVIEEGDLDAMVAPSEPVWMPESWRTLPSGKPMPDVVATVRRQRDEH
ncbi:MAG: helix-turn-helix domain-containing protein [Thermoleophilaceae bacterium]|nr:helix-turn-helix domain-containing protein [Thermoleophilaceae bacterium]